MALQILWFILWGTLWAVYFMTDGFDLGAGILHSFLARDEGEKRTVLRTFGPFWNGNEVWLVTAGGATFAAFPTTYAMMFSCLYTPLLLILFALILRGVALEFRGQGNSAGWRKGWDVAIFLGSLLPALLFGVAFGNIFEGIPMDAQGYHGTLITLLNPYGLLTGALFALLFMVHGSFWLTVKTDGAISLRAASAGHLLWFMLFVAVAAFLILTASATNLYANYLQNPVLCIVPSVAVLALFGIKLFALRQKYLVAFFSSCLTIVAITFTGVLGLYPNLIPSSTDKNYSLTIFNSSSSPYTLKIMTVVALIFVPVVIAYQVWVYTVFRRKITVEEVLAEKESY